MYINTALSSDFSIYRVFLKRTPTEFRRQKKNHYNRTSALTAQVSSGRATVNEEILSTLA
jgi:hypothetical protein